MVNFPKRSSAWNLRSLKDSSASENEPKMKTKMDLRIKIFEDLWSFVATLAYSRCFTSSLRLGFLYLNILYWVHVVEDLMPDLIRISSFQFWEISLQGFPCIIKIIIHQLFNFYFSENYYTSVIQFLVFWKLLFISYSISSLLKYVHRSDLYINHKITLSLFIFT